MKYLSNIVYNKKNYSFFKIEEILLFFLENIFRNASFYLIFSISLPTNEKRSHQYNIRVHL